MRHKLLAEISMLFFSALSAMAVDTTPPTNSNVRAQYIYSGGARIEWATNENANGFVEFGTTTAYGLTTAISPFIITTHSVSVSGLHSGTLYHYRVKAKDAAGNIGVSGDFTFTTLPNPPDFTPPSRPVLTAAAVSNTQVNLSWSASVDNPDGSGLANYKVYRNGREIATLTSTSFQDTGLTPVTSYSYEIQPYDVAGNPGILQTNIYRSNSVSLMTPGTIPDPTGATPTLSAISSSLSFQATLNGQLPLFQQLSFKNTAATTLYYKLTADQSWLWLYDGMDRKAVGASLPAGQTGGFWIFVDPVGLPLGTHNGTITITAVSGGKGQIQVPISVTVHPAGTPGIYPGTNISLDQTSINFTSSEWGQSERSLLTITNTSATFVSFAVQTPTAWLGGDASYGFGSSSKTLDFSVRGNGLAPGVYNDEIIITLFQNSNGRIRVPVTLTVTPQGSAPSSLSATETTSNSLRLNWTAGNSHVSGYRLDVSTNASFEGVVNGLRDLDLGNVTSYVLSDLQPQTTYYARLRSYWNGGSSGSTPTAYGTTLAPGGQSLLLSASSLALNEGASGTFTVRLANAPATNVSVAVARFSGDADIRVGNGAALTFTPANYATPQTVTIAAAEDDDTANDSAILSLSSAGLATQMVSVSAADNDARVKLTVNTTGNGSGTVTLNPPGGSYLPGTQVTVTAIPGPDSTFLGWSGQILGDTNPLKLVLNTNLTLTATFRSSARYTLSVSTSGTGTGTVALSPPGGTYDAGTAVQVTATAAAGSSFSGWSGALSGTNNPATIVLNAHIAVNASFTRLSGNTSPSLTSPATASPATAAVAQSVSFSVAASDPEGDALTYSWSFGDGASDAGSSVSHAFMTPGTYNAVVTITDSGGLDISSEVAVNVISSGNPPTPPLPLTISKLSGSTQFKSGGDKCAVSGVIPNLSPGLDFAGQQLVLNVAGAKVVFVLDAKGRGKSSLGSFALKISSKQRDRATKRFSGGEVSFSAKLQKGSWATAWNMDAASPGQKTTQMLTTLQLEGKTYAAPKEVTVSIKGNSGRFK